MHDLWLAACLLHPGLRYFSFARHATNESDAKERARRIIRKVLKNIPNDRRLGSGHEATIEVDHFSVDKPFQLQEAMYFLDRNDKGDELSIYLGERFSPNIVAFMKEDMDMGPVRYWVGKSH